MSRASTTVDYIMEHPLEAARLEQKVDGRAWVQKYLATRIRSGAEVLCVGCGPGNILREICALNPTVKGTGLDISAERIQEARRRSAGISQIQFARGDAQAMKFDSNRFDIVYTRMLLEYLKDKQAAVNEMVRVCKRGGTVLLQDLDGQLLWHFPEDSAVQSMAEKAVKALGATGFDPFVGRKLFSFAYNAGLENIDVQVESYHLIAGEVQPEILKQWELKLEIAEPQMARLLGSEAEAKKQTRQFLDYLKRPDTLTYSTVFTVTGEKSL